MGSSGGGGSSSGTQTNTLRYAEYIETKHKAFLQYVAEMRKVTAAASPFSDFVVTDVDDAFLGIGMTIGSYGALFGKAATYMEDIDTQTLYDTIFERILMSGKVKDVVVAEGSLLNDDVVENAIPRLMTGARDMNAVMSSTFIIGKAQIETARLKHLAKFSASLKFNLLPQVMEAWKTNLQWKTGIVEMHYKITQLYYASKLDYNNQNYEMQAKDSLWPFTVVDHERAALGALQGATNSKSVAGDSASSTQKAIGGALSMGATGAMIGGSVGGGPGAAVGFGVGAVVGGLASIF